jgi:hypothetical protein
MTYEEFAENMCRTGMYETIYTDSEGREILVIRLLDAYAVMSPSPREWTGLTDEEIESFVTSLWPLAEKQVRDRLRALEAKLKEKNT